MTNMDASWLRDARFPGKKVVYTNEVLLVSGKTLDTIFGLCAGLTATGRFAPSLISTKPNAAFGLCVLS